MESTAVPTGSNGAQAPKKPRLWHYLVAYVLLVPVWTMALVLWLKPRMLTVPGTGLARKLILILLPPLLLVLAVYVFRILHANRQSRKEQEKVRAAKLADELAQKEEEARRAAVLAEKRFTLEVSSMAAAVEYLRNGELWDEIQSQDDPGPILSEEPGDFASSREEKEQQHLERESETLESVLQWLTEEWTIPVFLAGPELHNPKMGCVLESYLTDAVAHGSPGCKLGIVERLFDNSPDTLWEKVFAFFDENASVPAVLVVAEDGEVLRNCHRSEESMEILTDAPRTEGSLAESTVAFLLTRRDRLEPMQAYSDVGHSALNNEVLKPFWEKQQTSRSAAGFAPSQWLPKPWSPELINRLRALPVLAHVHRPQRVSYEGENGILGEGSKAEAFGEGWKDALEGLEEGRKPERLFYDFGPVNQGRRLTPLCRTLATLDPDLDAFDHGVDLHRHLGETGAAAPFLGLALAVFAAQESGSVTAGIHLRRDDGCTLLMVSPHSQETPIEDPIASRA